MTKQEKKLVKRFALICCLTPKNNVSLMYFTLKDLFFNKVLHLPYFATYHNYLFYNEFDKLSITDLTLVYSCVCRCCKVRKINVYELKVSEK